MPTISSSSPARFRAAVAELSLCSKIGSAICDATVRTGFSAFIAPWNTIARSVHRCGLTESSPPREDVRPGHPDLAGHRSVRRQQPHHCQDAGRLAAAGLAHEAEPLAGVELEADALDGVQFTAARQLEPDMQVAHLKQAGSLISHRVRGQPAA